MITFDNAKENHTDILSDEFDTNTWSNYITYDVSANGQLYKLQNTQIHKDIRSFIPNKARGYTMLELGSLGKIGDISTSPIDGWSDGFTDVGHILKSTEGETWIHQVVVSAVAASTPTTGYAQYTTAGHTLSVGQIVTVSGASVAGYNGKFVVTSVSGNTFAVANTTTGAATFTSGLATYEGYGQRILENNNAFGLSVNLTGTTPVTVYSVTNSVVNLTDFNNSNYSIVFSMPGLATSGCTVSVSLSTDSTFPVGSQTYTTTLTSGSNSIAMSALPAAVVSGLKAIKFVITPTATSKFVCTAIRCLHTNYVDAPLDFNNQIYRLSRTPSKSGSLVNYSTWDPYAGVAQSITPKILQQSWPPMLRSYSTTTVNGSNAVTINYNANDPKPVNIDSSVIFNTGSIISPETTARKSVSFDGSSYLTISNANAATAIQSNAFTIEGWIAPSALPTATIPIAKIGDTSTGVELSLVYTSSTDIKPTVKYYTSAGNPIGVGTSVHGSTWSSSTWHHVAATFDGTNLVVYFDGVALTTTVTGTIAAMATMGVTGNSYVGRIGSTYAPSTVKFDDVAFYDKALTASQIASHYNSYSTSKTLYTYIASNDGAIGFWQMDESSSPFYNGIVFDNKIINNSTLPVVNYTITNATPSIPSTGYVQYTAAGHTFTAGTTVKISGSSPAAYNGEYTIVSVPKFTVTDASSATPSAGSVQYTATGHNFVVGQEVIITGSSVSGYNGTFTITSVSTDKFVVSNSTTGSETWTNGLADGGFVVESNATGSETWSSGLAIDTTSKYIQGTVTTSSIDYLASKTNRLYYKSDADTYYQSNGSTSNPQWIILATPVTNASTLTISGSGITKTDTNTKTQYTTSAAHNLILGQPVKITGCSPDSYNTTAVVTDIISSTQFKIASTANPSYAITNATPSTPSTGYVQYTATGHTFTQGQQVTITGSDISGYNGTFTIVSVAANTFDVVNTTTGVETWTSGLAATTTTGGNAVACWTPVAKATNSGTVTSNSESTSTQYNQVGLILRETGNQPYTQYDFTSTAKGGASNKTQLDLENLTSLSIKDSGHWNNVNYSSFYFASLIWNANGAYVQLQDELSLTSSSTQDRTLYKIPVIGLLPNKNYQFNVLFEDSKFRIYITDLDDQYLRLNSIQNTNYLDDTCVFDTNWIYDERIIRRKGRFGWWANLYDGDAYVRKIGINSASYAEYVSETMRSRTPVSGTQIFHESSPAIELFDSALATGVGATLQNSLNNKYAVATTSTGGMLQGLVTNEFVVHNSKLNINFNLFATDANNIKAYLFSTDQDIERQINLTLPDFINNKINNVKIPVEGVGYGNYKLYIVQEKSTNNLIKIENISIQSPQVEWSARNDNNFIWQNYNVDGNNLHNGLMFGNRGKNLQIKAVAKNQFGSIQKIKTVPKYAELGAFDWSSPFVGSDNTINNIHFDKQSIGFYIGKTANSLYDNTTVYLDNPSFETKTTWSISGSDAFIYLGKEIRGITPNSWFTESGWPDSYWTKHTFNTYYGTTVWFYEPMTDFNNYSTVQSSTTTVYSSGSSAEWRIPALHSDDATLTSNVNGKFDKGRQYKINLKVRLDDLVYSSVNIKFGNLTSGDYGISTLSAQDNGYQVKWATVTVDWRPARDYNNIGDVQLQIVKPTFGTSADKNKIGYVANVAGPPTPPTPPAITDSSTSIILTTLYSPLSQFQASYPLKSVPSSGTVLIDNEYINYTNAKIITSGTYASTDYYANIELSGLTRGVRNTASANHSSGAQVSFASTYYVDAITIQTYSNGSWVNAIQSTDDTSLTRIGIDPSTIALTTTGTSKNTSITNVKASSPYTNYVTYAASGNVLVAGQSVTITGSSVSGYNGTFTVVSTNNNSFTVVNATTGATTWTSGNAAYVAGLNTYKLTAGTSYQFYASYGKSAQGNGTTAANSKTISSVVTTAGQFVIGQVISGSTIPVGTRITKVDGSTITMSNAALSSGSTNITGSIAGTVTYKWIFDDGMIKTGQLVNRTFVAAPNSALSTLTDQCSLESVRLEVYADGKYVGSCTRGFYLSS